MKRIYHHHEKWEEVKYNMYGSVNPKERNMLIQKVINYFKQKSLVEKNMAFVIDNFKYSCEHNFTNPSMNKIAWLGQTSLAVYGNIPNDVVMEAWNYLDEKTQDRANEIAKGEINRWLHLNDPDTIKKLNKIKLLRC